MRWEAEPSGLFKLVDEVAEKEAHVVQAARDRKPGHKGEILHAHQGEKAPVEACDPRNLVHEVSIRSHSFWSTNLDAAIKGVNVEPRVIAVLGRVLAAMA